MSQLLGIFASTAFQANPKNMGRIHTLKVAQLPNDITPLIVRLIIKDKITKEEIDCRYECRDFLMNRFSKIEPSQ
jgi:hypothetical protein